MTPQEVLSAAKQGNPQAIAALMNRSLKPKGITAKVKLTDSCLHVMLEGVTVPNQGAIVPYVTNGIKGLEIAAFRSLVVYGRVTGEDLPAWSDRVELVEAHPTPAPVVKVSKPEIVAPSAAKPRGSTANKIGLAVVGLIIVFMAWAVVQNIWARSQPSELGLRLEESTRKLQESLTSPKHTISGKLNIAADSESPLFYRIIKNSSETSCSGDGTTKSGSFSDIKEGTELTVKDSEGKLLAVGSLGPGKVITNTATGACEFEILIRDVPKSDFYTVRVGSGGRGDLNYSAKDLEKDNWQINLSLNN